MRFLVWEKQQLEKMAVRSINEIKVKIREYESVNREIPFHTAKTRSEKYQEFWEKKLERYQDLLKKIRTL